jgi:hypothetical protein
VNGYVFSSRPLLVLTFCQAIDISKIMITDFSFGRIVANGQTCNSDIIYNLVNERIQCDAITIQQRGFVLWSDCGVAAEFEQHLG